MLLAERYERTAAALSRADSAGHGSSPCLVVDQQVARYRDFGFLTLSPVEIDAGIRNGGFRAESGMTLGKTADGE